MLAFLFYMGAGDLNLGADAGLALSWAIFPAPDYIFKLLTSSGQRC